MSRVAGLYMKSSKFWFSCLALTSLIVVSVDIHGRELVSDEKFSTADDYAIADGCAHLAEQAKGATFVC